MIEFLKHRQAKTLVLGFHCSNGASLNALSYARPLGGRHADSWLAQTICGRKKASPSTGPPDEFLPLGRPRQARSPGYARKFEALHNVTSALQPELPFVVLERGWPSRKSQSVSVDEVRVGRDLGLPFD